MIDIKLLRENPEIIKKNNKNRGYDISIDEILKLDTAWRVLKTEDDILRAERNKISEQINQAKKEKKSVDSLLKKAKADFIVANDVSKGVFGSEDNDVYIIDKNKKIKHIKASKREIAQKILGMIGW